ncbi:MAG: DUF4339 domain-containing protein [bacterium]|nr:DUF4339 domain-containing protein [bacterium]
MDQTWYVMVGDAQQGPLSEAKVRDLVESGSATGASFCWQQGMQDWQPLESVEAFSSLLGAPGTPPPAPTPKPGTGDPVSAFFDRGKRGALRTMKGAKLKIELMKLSKTREKLCALLGAEVYALGDGVQLPETVVQHVENIAQCDAEIAAIEGAMGQK